MPLDCATQTVALHWRSVETPAPLCASVRLRMRDVCVTNRVVVVLRSSWSYVVVHSLKYVGGTTRRRDIRRSSRGQ